MRKFWRPIRESSEAHRLRNTGLGDQHIAMGIRRSYQVEMFGNSVKKILAVAFRVQLELRVAAVQQGHVDNHGELEKM